MTGIEGGGSPKRGGDGRAEVLAINGLCMGVLGAAGMVLLSANGVADADRDDRGACSLLSFLLL